MRTAEVMADKEKGKQLKMKQVETDETEAEGDTVTVCPKWAENYEDSTDIWVFCDKCDTWYNLKCTNIKKKRIQNHFL